MNRWNISALIRSLVFLFIFLLTVLAIDVLQNNYPDAPVSGRQKSRFNKLFLLNFVFLAFLFGIVFAEYKDLSNLIAVIDRRIYTLPFEFYIPLLSNTFILIFQFMLLYGLFVLRRELYSNFVKKEFDFERQGG